MTWNWLGQLPLPYIIVMLVKHLPLDYPPLKKGVIGIRDVHNHKVRMIIKKLNYSLTSQKKILARKFNHFWVTLKVARFARNIVKFHFLLPSIFRFECEQVSLLSHHYQRSPSPHRTQDWFLIKCLVPLFWHTTNHYQSPPNA